MSSGRKAIVPYQSEALNQDMTPSPSDLQIHTVLADIASYVRLQQEVTMLRVSAQQKRSAVSRLLANVAQQDKRNVDTIRESRLSGRRLDHKEYDSLLSKLLTNSECARDQLGPAEQALTDVDIQLVNMETKLAAKGRAIQQQYLQASNTSLEQLISAATILPATGPESDGVSTRISYETSSAAEAPTTRDAGSQGMIAHKRLNNSQPRDGLSHKSQPAQLALPPNVVQDPTPVPHVDLERLKAYAADLESSDATGADQEPQLYVIEDDLPELRDTRANSVEHMEPVLTAAFPRSLSVLPRHFQLFRRPSVHLQRWRMHHLRKSPREMIDYNGMLPEAADRALGWSEHDRDGWAEIFFLPTDPGEECSQPGHPPEVRIPASVWW